MAVWIDTGVYRALDTGVYRALVLTCMVMPEDIAITLSKSDVDPCSHGRETDHQKVWTDRQMDRQMAFQVYIVDYIE